jgi:SpoVK/Ycf46/Vps4 family AAA+-type ATPase
VTDLIQGLYKMRNREESASFFKLSNEDQINFLLSMSMENISKLITFLHTQLQCESYLFAQKSIDLKRHWPMEVETALNDVLYEKDTENVTQEDESKRNVIVDKNHVKDLESFLIKNEVVIASKSDEILCEVMTKSFQSQEALWKQVPLLESITQALTAVNFQLLCGHYVFLRLKLRSIMKILSTKQVKKAWYWSIKDTICQQQQYNQHDTPQKDAMYNIQPWFLIQIEKSSSSTIESANEIARYHRKQRMVKKIQKFWKAHKDVMVNKRKRVKLANHGTVQIVSMEIIDNSVLASSPQRNVGPSIGAGRGRGRGRSSGRGAGRGSIVEGSLGIIAKAASLLHASELAIGAVQNMIESIPASQWTELQIEQLKLLVQESIKQGADISKELVLQKANKLIEEIDQQIKQAKADMDITIGKSSTPLNLESLEMVLNTFQTLGLHEGTGRDVYHTGSDLLFQAKVLMQSVKELLERQYSPAEKEVIALINQLQAINMNIDPKLLAMLDRVKGERDFLRNGLESFFIQYVSNDTAKASKDALIDQLIDAFYQWPHLNMLDLDPSWTSVEFQRVLGVVFPAIDYCNTDLQKTNKDVDVLINALKKVPLKSWILAPLMMSVAYSSPTHFDLYESDCQDLFVEYLTLIINSHDHHVPIHGFMPIVIARLSASTDPRFSQLWLARCDHAIYRKWLTRSECAWLDSPSRSFIQDAAKLPPVSTVAAKGSTVAATELGKLRERWQQLIAQESTLPLQTGSSITAATTLGTAGTNTKLYSDAIEELLDMIGLLQVKRNVIDIFESIVLEMNVPVKSRVLQTYHFLLMGNPGTGKTTVGKLLGRMLHDVGIRKTDKFIETSGEKLVRMGASKAAQLIASAMDGVLFIDEAYALDPAKSQEGAAIAMQLLEEAEANRGKFTIILAGYKQDIEVKLFEYNDGFFRRFPFKLQFEDYTDDELAQIFQQLCERQSWQWTSPDVIRCAARKVGRRRGHKNFGNAGAVRELFEASYRRALKRTNHQVTFVVEDVLGPYPNPDTNPELASALDELNNTIGLQAVKQKIESLIRLAQSNYQLEIAGKDPVAPTLNRVFFGNPGTGKTTIAKLYGRILKGLGFLSDGNWELKQPKDFIGSVVGETQQKTSSLLDRCKGKILIVDEAYGFHGNSIYGKEAIDTMVGMIHGEPGEDIAVIFIGYEKPMRKMFADMNPGLSSRFAIQDPFVFEDYSESELERIAMKALQANKLRMSRQVREALVKTISTQRFAPNFGNARTVVSMITKGKEKLMARDPSLRDLTWSDLGLSSPEEQANSDPFQALRHLFKIDHILKELQVLQSVIKQCEQDGRDIRSFLKNYLFIGNPGTGKTTVARVMANLLNNMGLLARDHVVVRSALELQGDYVGQTKTKVTEAMTEAQGGVLFIDEAYGLFGGGRNGGSSIFAKEAVDQLVALMTAPEHLHNTVVILAGYPGQMQQMLTSSNDGLLSRCTGRLDFPDWDAMDCLLYMKQQFVEESMTFDSDTTEALLRSGLQELCIGSGWANARDCISLVKALYESRAQRGSTLRVYEAVDVNYALASLGNSRVKSTNNLISTRDFPLATDLVNSLLEAPRCAADSALHLKQDQRQQEVQKPQQSQRQNAKEFAAIALKTTKTKVKTTETDPDDLNPIFVALLQACREAGYDDNLIRRKALVVILEAVLQGGVLSEDILSIVMKKIQNRLQTSEVMQILRPQVPIVLDGMKHAILVEELYISKVKDLQNALAKAATKEERDRITREIEQAGQKAREEADIQEKLKQAGTCPMGFTWHPCGNGWRCAGGSHFISSAELMHL